VFLGVAAPADTLAATAAKSADKMQNALTLASNISVYMQDLRTTLDGLSQLR
jgi:hypothetical protein